MYQRVSLYRSHSNSSFHQSDPISTKCRCAPRLVWEFYSIRRRVASAAKPNPAHFALAKLENTLQDRLFVCTQSVDNLHEQAGAKKVVHMHGELFKSRCDSCTRLPFHDANRYEPPGRTPPLRMRRR
jgi:NAD-dependent deacetylase